MTVDVSRAMVMGRRAIRRRRLVAGAAAALVLAALVGGVVGIRGLVDVDREGGPDVIQPADSVPAARGASSSASASTAFDPTSRYASFGWLPDGLKTSGHGTSPTRGLLFASYEPEAVTEMTVHLDFWAAGLQPDLPVNGDRAPAVNGAPARWSEDGYEAGVQVLQWEYAPDAQAQLRVRIDRMKGANDPKQVVHRIATGVTFGEPRKITLPFETAGLPDSCEALSTWVFLDTFGEGGDMVPWNASLECKRSVSDPNVHIVVNVYPSTNRDGYDNNTIIGRPNTTVDGNPAFRGTGCSIGACGPGYAGGEYARLAVFDVDGNFVNVLARDDVPGGPEAVFRALKVKSGWTPS